MKSIRRPDLVGVALAVAACMIIPASVSGQMPVPPPGPPLASAASASPWLGQFSHDGREFQLYPPELDRWQGDRLEGRAAVSVRAAGTDAPVFGTISWAARTRLDPTGPEVAVSDISIVRATFPTEPEHARDFSAALQRYFAGATWITSRARLASNLAVERAAEHSHGEPVRNDPPRILYSDTPAILVPIDGAPVLREMVGLDLARVVNTRALLVSDKNSARYFLFVAGGWLEAPVLDGPWTTALVRPTALDEAKEQALAAGQVDLLDDDRLPEGEIPAIYVRTAPTELIQTEGAPQYAPIERTQLLYVVNSPDRLFLDLATQEYYVLLSGRWFRARSLEQSTWEFVAGSELPADFARIPDQHPTESVRTSVPGTPQAQEAAIASAAPRLAAVTRGAAGLELTYDGPPQFRPIEGTSLQYAVNAPMPVIRVDWRNVYALDNGVWFFANAAEGPWAVAADVPAVIYTIPRSSPLHYVTYVRVYDATDDDVYVGYTPGYVGSYVTPDDTVVYGTGWLYPPWVGSVWYGAPTTWGFGFSVWRTWWNPRHPWRAARPVPCFHPWWGPWRAPVAAHHVVVTHSSAIVTGAVNVRARRVIATGAGGRDSNVADIYHRWSGRVVARAQDRPTGVNAPAPARTDDREAAHRPGFRGDRGRQRFADEGRWDEGREAPRSRFDATTARAPIVISPGADPTSPTVTQPFASQPSVSRQFMRTRRGPQSPVSVTPPPASRPLVAPLAPSIAAPVPARPAREFAREPASFREPGVRRQTFRMPDESRPAQRMLPAPAARHTAPAESRPVHDAGGHQSGGRALR